MPAGRMMMQMVGAFARRTAGGPTSQEGQTCQIWSSIYSSTTQRNPSVPARSFEGAISRYLPCSVNR